MNHYLTRERLNRRMASLHNERASYLPHYRDLADFFLPRRGQWLADSPTNNGAKRNSKLVDPHPRLAARTLSSGMVAGLTSPARPWFRLQTPDPELNEYAAVKSWLDDVTRRMRDVFSKSNIYNALPSIYLELGIFGTAPMLLDEDAETVVRAYPFTVGSYAVAQDYRLRVNTFMRDLRMSVEQMASQFGLENLSTQTRSLYASGQYDTYVGVCHAVVPNDDKVVGAADYRGMDYLSVYWEKGGDGDKCLRIKGYHDDPLMCPRWELASEEVYGSSPGMDALGLSKALQLQTKRKAQVIDKHVDPPVNAPTSARNTPMSLLPGAVNYIDATQSSKGLEPVYVVRPEIQALLEDIQDQRQGISRCLYEDLFLMLAQSDRRQITAREIEERHEEKLLMLGPVLERLNDELLDPMIDRVFNVMMRRGLIPTPPQEIQGADLKVEYISILAQAQRAVATAGLERLAGFVGAIAPVQPSVVDKIDFDQMIDEYGSAIGIPARVIVSDDDVQATRQARAQQEAAQQAAMMAQPMAQGAQAVKSLSEAKVGGDTGQSVLDQIMGSTV